MLSIDPRLRVASHAAISRTYQNSGVLNPRFQGGMFLGSGVNPDPKNLAVNCQLSTVNCLSTILPLPHSSAPPAKIELGIMLLGEERESK
jgi:hypothetical protein